MNMPAFHGVAKTALLGHDRIELLGHHVRE
jgi:hypothetical protein